MCFQRAFPIQPFSCWKSARNTLKLGLFPEIVLFHKPASHFRLSRTDLTLETYPKSHHKTFPLFCLNSRGKPSHAWRHNRFAGVAAKLNPWPVANQNKARLVLDFSLSSFHRFSPFLTSTQLKMARRRLLPPEGLVMFYAILECPELCFLEEVWPMLVKCKCCILVANSFSARASCLTKNSCMKLAVISGIWKWYFVHCASLSLCIPVAIVLSHHCSGHDDAVHKIFDLY